MEKQGEGRTGGRPQQPHCLTPSWAPAVSARQGREGLRAGVFPPEFLLFSYNNGVVRTPCRDLDNNRSALSAASAFAIATAGANEGAPNKEKYRRMSLASAGARGGLSAFGRLALAGPRPWPVLALRPEPPSSHQPRLPVGSWVPTVKSVAHGSPVTPTPHAGPVL